VDHFIDSIDIQNFKSIRQLHIAGLNRINLLIGRPNVGKSNILEALGLFSVPYIWQEGSRDVTDLIRLQNQQELFYNGDIYELALVKLTRAGTKEIIETAEVSFKKSIRADTTNALNIKLSNLKTTFDLIEDEDTTTYIVVDNLKIAASTIRNKAEFIYDIKFYIFNKKITSKIVRHSRSQFQVPFGDNIVYILELYPELRQLFGQWFRQYGLRLVLDISTQSIKVQKDKSEDEVFQLPYSSIADTLQRIIFYKTAIHSNTNSVLIFEEPEAHAYPQYISEFTQDVIQSKTNQFFIVTHSPYVVADFIEDDEAFDDLAIFMVDFKDGQTVTRPLSREELIRVRRYGIDLFFNGDQFLP
jgi:AAA15 family ATPase/GTPase